MHPFQSHTTDPNLSREKRQEWVTKVGLAEMLKGGVIMDVMNAEQARIAQKAGAVAVMALERIPALIRQHGGVARMSDPEMIEQIKQAVTIPVMAKCRIGHFAEAQILEAVQVDFIDESEVLTPADNEHHIWKHNFKVPFVCGARSLGEALRRISEGAAMIRTKGDAGSGNVVEAVTHVRAIQSDIRRLTQMSQEELMSFAREHSAPVDLVFQTAKNGRLPVPNFAAGGVATPADAALLMQLGAEAVFVGSGIFMSEDPAQRAEAIVQAVTHYEKPEVLAKVSAGLGTPMKGLDKKVETVTLSGSMPDRPKIGILALQGNYHQHAEILRNLGIDPIFVRTANDLAPDVDGLLIPGGESSTMAKLLKANEGLREAILRLAKSGKPMLGTCAGLVLMATKLEPEDEMVEPLGLLDITVQRNAYGPQINSQFRSIKANDGAHFTVSFIRAPAIVQVKEPVEILAQSDGHPCAVRQGNIVGISFHPELSNVTYFHEIAFLNVINKRSL
ncbi:SOR/SNZ family domain-containing protein [Ditylenchus destructor]|uniref:pyridoxal 5'-phosphate synthase (glutamine hydrolyzing) n=1 Tax=Ditylenchus destructor TaxID=166010 RepID=A0AAD4RAS8_9BILA|nr:SOR/SNZ family domain-containing protein [Ditylenchus destructor]